MRILVVEDEPVAAALLAKGLREHAYAVDVAADGRRGAEQAEINDYDLIILDVMLPGINGLELCRRLRADGRRGADPDADGARRARPTGRRARCRRRRLPAEAVPLSRNCSRASGRCCGVGRRWRPSVLTIDDLTIDTRARRVERAGRAIQLTTKEYALLEYLARRQGEVVGRADIAEHVWDDSFDPMSNLIEVYIQRLRRKIDDGHRVKLIRTRRGAGYMLRRTDGEAPMIDTVRAPVDAVTCQRLAAALIAGRRTDLRAACPGAL